MSNQETNTEEYDPQESEPADFQPRRVEQPIVDSELRSRVEESDQEPAAEPKSFYQANKVFIWAIAGGLVIIAALFFVLLRKPKQVAPTQAKVDVAITLNGDPSATSVANNGEAIYYVKVANKDVQKLTNVQLELDYPEGFAYIDSTPAAQPSLDKSQSMFSIPDLQPNGPEVTVIVKTRASGNVNDTKTLHAILHYHFSNFNSDFTTKKDFDIQLAAAQITLDLSGPQSVTPGQIVVYTAHYVNNSDGDLKNVKIRFTYPPGFSFAAGNPQPSIGNNVWNLGTVLKGGEGTVAVQGSFTSTNPGENKTVQTDLVTTGPDGSELVQNTAQFSTGIASTPLQVTQQLDSSEAPMTVDPGQTITYDIKYQNNASTAATGVNIVMTLDSKALDLSTIRAEGAQVTGSTLTWNASMVPKLETLAPNESGDVKVTIQVKNPATKDSSKNLNVNSSVKIKSNEYMSYFNGGDLQLKVTSPAILSKSLLYSDGQLPPQVGKTTTYNVSLQLSNSTNDFSSTVVTAFIPLGPSGFVQGSVNADQVSNVNYDPATGKLTWNVGSLPAHAGQFSPAKALRFQVKLNPSSSMAGSQPVLVKNIQFTATDTYTGQQVTGSAEDVTTDDIPGNSYGNGSVQQ